MRRPLVAFALVLGCAVGPIDETSTIAEDSGTTSVATSTGDTGDTGEAPCDPNACAQSCGDDECGNPMFGVCTDAETCACEPRYACLPCDEANCSEYESCPDDHSINGECATDCSHEFPPYLWDPEVGCTLALPTDLPDAPIFPYFYVMIAGRWMPRAESCDDPQAPYAWWLDEDALTITVCPPMCADFEQVGSLVTGWLVRCE